MRLDPSHIGDPLRQLGGGAVDAAQGQHAQREAAAAEGESAYEPLDQLLLKRLKVAQLADAAAVSSFAEALGKLRHTRSLMEQSQADAHAAHGDLARDRLRNLLGDS